MSDPYTSDADELQRSQPVAHSVDNDCYPLVAGHVIETVKCDGCGQDLGFGGGLCLCMPNLMRAPLKVVRIHPGAKLPAYQTAGAAGLDLQAMPSSNGLARALPLTLAPCERATIGTGVAMAIPRGYEGQVRGRSSLAVKHGVMATLGTIDADYRGELLVQLVNHGSEPFTVNIGDRIAQIVIAPVARCEVVEAEGLDETVRGAGGFGSTGR